MPHRIGRSYSAPGVNRDCRYNMIQITPQMRILVAIEPVDLRKGIDGLAQLCREKLGTDPFSGYLFIFRGRRATAIKLLAFDGHGNGGRPMARCVTWCAAVCC